MVQTKKNVFWASKLGTQTWGWGDHYKNTGPSQPPNPPRNGPKEILAVCRKTGIPFEWCPIMFVSWDSIPFKRNNPIHIIRSFDGSCRKNKDFLWLLSSSASSQPAFHKRSLLTFVYHSKISWWKNLLYHTRILMRTLFTNCQQLRTQDLILIFHNWAMTATPSASVIVIVIFEKSLHICLYWSYIWPKNFANTRNCQCVLKNVQYIFDRLPLSSKIFLIQALPSWIVMDQVKIDAILISHKWMV